MGSTFYITFDNAQGIEKGDAVIINDYQIGEVTNISINNNDFSIFVEIVLNDTIHIPKDSKFSIVSRDFFSKAIEIIPGTSNSYLSSTDKIIGERSERMNMDTLLHLISKEIDNSKPVKNQDSIVKQLNELNTELKELNQQIEK